MLRTIFIVLILAPGPYGYQSFGALNNSIRLVQDIYKDGGFFLSFSEKYYARGNARFLAPLSQRVATFQRVKAWKGRQLKLKNRAAYVMIPPSVDESGIRWMWGMSQVCNPQGVAVGVGLPERLTGESREYQSAIVAAHEIGHLVGASHNASEQSVMHEDAIRVSTQRRLSFTAQDVREIKNCTDLKFRRVYERLR